MTSVPTLPRYGTGLTPEIFELPFGVVSKRIGTRLLRSPGGRTGTRPPRCPPTSRCGHKAHAGDSPDSSPAPGHRLFRQTRHLHHLPETFRLMIHWYPLESRARCFMFGTRRRTSTRIPYRRTC